MDGFGELEFVGPRESHDVVHKGWQVPFLEATPLIGGRIYLCLDRRFSLELTVNDAERVVPFIADCIAVALGYTAHPERDAIEPKRRHPIAQVRAIGWQESSEAAV
jgi:hypothetical protein